MDHLQWIPYSIHIHIFYGCCCRFVAAVVVVAGVAGIAAVAAVIIIVVTTGPV